MEKTDEYFCGWTEVRSNENLSYSYYREQKSHQNTLIFQA